MATSEPAGNRAGIMLLTGCAADLEPQGGEWKGMAEANPIFLIKATYWLGF